MQKTKIIILLIATSLVVMAAVGVTYAQQVNAQNPNATYNQTPTQGYNGNYGYLPPNNGTGYYCPYQQGYYPYGVPQGINPYQYGGMGCGRCR